MTVSKMLLKFATVSSASLLIGGLSGCNAILSTSPTVEKANELVTNEVCATVKFIYYDSEFDRPETVDQVIAHNTVLAETYNCKAPHDG